jgi:RimJ/RimL family protein N-acetyltransferase
VDDELVIASGHLILRPVIEEDADPLVNIYADPIVRSALGKDKPPPTQDDLRASIGAIRAIWGAMTVPRPCMMFAIVRDGRVIGVTEVVFGQSDEGGREPSFSVASSAGHSREIRTYGKFGVLAFRTTRLRLRS